MCTHRSSGHSKEKSSCSKQTARSIDHRAHLNIACGPWKLLLLPSSQLEDLDNRCDDPLRRNESSRLLISKAIKKVNASRITLLRHAAWINNMIVCNISIDRPLWTIDTFGACGVGVVSVNNKSVNSRRLPPNRL